MTEKTISKLEILLSDESKIVFANGDVIEGAKQVVGFMVGAAEAYNKGYLIGLRRRTAKAVIGGLIIYGTVKLYKSQKKQRV